MKDTRNARKQEMQQNYTSVVKEPIMLFIIFILKSMVFPAI
jgi:hypothetical protein